MRTWRVWYRLPASVVATAVCALIPGVVRLATFRSVRATSWASMASIRLWGRSMCTILGVKRRVQGRVPRGCFVLAANHLSYLDILVLGSLYPSIFVAKAEIRDWPLFGWIARGAGTLWVDRDRPRDVVRAGVEMSRRLASGIPITLFPEGRSTRGVEVLPFMPSLLEPAAKAGVPCWAATLRYETPGTELPPAISVCWYDRADFVTHILRLMKLPRIDAHVVFASESSNASDRKELARRLWEHVHHAFIPVRQDAAEGAEA